MLEGCESWNTGRHRISYERVVRPTDADREIAYDRGSHIGQLAKGPNDAKLKG
jgi:hypothetical protein